MTIKFPILILLASVLILSGCDRKKGPVAEPVVPEFNILPATFHPLGGVVESFNIHIERIGNIPIEEYGVTYAFLESPTAQNPLGNGKNLVFTQPMKEGDIQQTVKLGFPSNTHFLIYGAYVKAKDGRVFRSTEQFDLNY